MADLKVATVFSLSSFGINLFTEFSLSSLKGTSRKKRVGKGEGG